VSETKLSEVVEAYRGALPPGTEMEFEITALDHLGMPVWSSALWPVNGPFCNGIGYGLTPEAARVSAYGECMESASAWRTLSKAKRTRVSYRDLTAQYGENSVLDPVAGCLPAGSDYTPDTTLEWVEARRYPNNEEVLVPVEFAATRGADVPGLGMGDLLFTPVTNGLGAGLDLERALSHAVMEILQRDGNGVSFRALDRGIVVDLDAVEDAGTRDLLALLDAEGVEATVKMAATDFGIPNLYAVGRDRDGYRAAIPIVASASGEAAHPNRERALQKALSELCSARVRKSFNHGPLGPIDEISPPGYVERFRESPLGSEEDRSLRATLDWLTLSHEEMVGLLADTSLAEGERVPFSSLPTERPEGNDSSLLGLLAGRLGAEGYGILYVDLSPQDGSGVRAVKALVPGLEVETMSYGRIGARNLRRLLDRDSDLVGLGDPPKDRPRARRILLPEREEGKLGGPAWFDYDAAEKIVGRLYPLYREPGRHVAALAAEERGVYRT
jgi:thiazole/oxazole-forming peptide maturase SagD family component